MPNAMSHRIGAAAMMAMVASDTTADGKPDPTRQMAAACGGAVFGTLPDILEPATNPRHRQFFHSVVCAGAVGYVCYRLYQWKPETAAEEFMRGVLLIAGGSFLTHLAMDALSPSGLPLLGRM
ncbi:MAG: metal-dependent hydrolase [Rhodocyclaceae bacterium]|nr:metal-dependent hydrolase [Rhodocyclaceae bacterium]